MAERGLLQSHPLRSLSVSNGRRHADRFTLYEILAEGTGHHPDPLSGTIRLALGRGSAVRFTLYEKHPTSVFLHQTDSKPKPAFRPTRSSTRRFFYRFLPSRLCPPPPTISGPRRRSGDTTAFVWVSEPIRLIKDGYFGAYCLLKYYPPQGTILHYPI